MPAPALPGSPAAAPGNGAFQLGERVRRLRAERGLTLEDVAVRAGLARSTLSKIENDHTSPTFEVLLKLANGLGLALDELLTLPRSSPPSGRRSITRNDQGQRQDTGLYSHEFLCTDLTSKNIVPSKARIHARALSDFSGWVRHEGEDFLLILEGAVELHTEFYAPVRMEAGDSAYFDARMGHLCISVSEQDALVLWVPTHGDEAEAARIATSTHRRTRG
ncbi:MAG: helix-turn-helix domain-containing protein [Burkholderiaceae bacterium]